MSFFHFQWSWIMMTAFICWSDHLSKIITDWHEILNEFSFQMIIWIHMYRNSFFVWSLIILWIFSQASLWVIVFSNFMCSSKSYFLTWNHMWAFVLCLHDILVMSECRAFHFVTNQLTCSFDQQNYSHQFVAIILSWNHVH